MIPPVKFTRSVQTTPSGTRVAWRSVRDCLHHPQSFEIVASGEGIRICGYSPVLQGDDAGTLADVLGQAAEVVDMIRDGFSASDIARVLDVYLSQKESESCKAK